MPIVKISNVQINFPLTPYQCQYDYMEKVIQCLQTDSNGVLESPTGTGKTLSLLCSSLAWLSDKKAQIANKRWGTTSCCNTTPNNEEGIDYRTDSAKGGGGGSGGGLYCYSGSPDDADNFKQSLNRQLDMAAGTWNGELGVPKIIYASRTHTQLSQAMQELKRTSYKHFKACILGSREQMCIHPDIIKVDNPTAKIHMCRSKVKHRTCHYYNNMEAFELGKMTEVMDMEDLVSAGRKNSICPYYASREMKKDADIIFAPYNYLLDPNTRKAHGIELQGNVLIFDEAHNLERMCEDSASFELVPGDFASAVDDLNSLLEKLTKAVQGGSEEMVDMMAIGVDYMSTEEPDFTLQEVLLAKDIILKLEACISDIKLDTVAEDRNSMIDHRRGVNNFGGGEQNKTLDGGYMYDMMEESGLNFQNKSNIIIATEKMVANLTNDVSSSVFSSRGTSLNKFCEIFAVLYSGKSFESNNHDESTMLLAKKEVSKYYKIHIKLDNNNNNSTNKKQSKPEHEFDWMTTTTSKNNSVTSLFQSKANRTLSYWCFSPGFTMRDLIGQGVKVVILTSGTLYPLKSFAEDFAIEFPIKLENPHVIDSSQVFIGSLSKGPDGKQLNSSFKNRSSEEYMKSLGFTILNLARTIPKGMLIFFPSYPVMQNCISYWQKGRMWSSLEASKAVFVESREKGTFLTSMSSYYDKIKDSSDVAGAIFMAICRGKVSEGLDFADNNGRAVLITGLPYPPIKDARVKLKMEYLDKNTGYNLDGTKKLTGQDWYSLECSRAVNQAIGRVIRHRHDFGAVILLDERFANAAGKNNLPKWLSQGFRSYSNFAEIVPEVRKFFARLKEKYPDALNEKPRPRKSVDCAKNSNQSSSCGFDFLSTTNPVESKLKRLNVFKLPRACDYDMDLLPPEARQKKRHITPIYEGDHDDYAKILQNSSQYQLDFLEGKNTHTQNIKNPDQWSSSNGLLARLERAEETNRKKRIASSNYSSNRNSVKEEVRGETGGGGCGGNIQLDSCSQLGSNGHLDRSNLNSINRSGSTAINNRSGNSVNRENRFKVVGRRNVENLSPHHSRSSNDDGGDITKNCDSVIGAKNCDSVVEAKNCDSVVEAKKNRQSSEIASSGEKRIATATENRLTTITSATEEGKENFDDKFAASGFTNGRRIESDRNSVVGAKTKKIEANKNKSTAVSKLVSTGDGVAVSKNKNKSIIDFFHRSDK